MRTLRLGVVPHLPMVNVATPGWCTACGLAAVDPVHRSMLEVGEPAGAGGQDDVVKDLG